MNLKTSKTPDPSDPRAQAAMPFLASPPASQAQPDSAQPGETMPNLNDPNDPDAQNLPPNIVLPEAAQYRLQQIKAQVVNFAIITAFILLWALLVIRDRPIVGLVCTAIGGSGLALALLRFWLAKKSFEKTARNAPGQP